MFLYRLLGVSFPRVQLSVFQNLHLLTEILFCSMLSSVICSAIYFGLFEFIDHFRNHPYHVIIHVCLELVTELGSLTLGGVMLPFVLQ